MLDIKGKLADPFSWRIVISIIITAACIIIGNALPLDAFGESTGLALGFFVGFVSMFIINPWSLVVSSILMVITGYMLGFWTWPEFQASTGTSSFLQLLCMMVVALGAETTPVGRRIALTMLKKWGKKPVTMVVVFGALSAILSSVVSDNAVMILMASIANNMLLTMEEKPGESRLGRAIITVICAGSFLGGSILISGAPLGNTYAISLMKAASGGIGGISFRQWAAMGIPAFIVVAIPLGLIYAKCNKLSNHNQTSTVSDDYYDKLLKELGPIDGSEIRWILITLTMVVLLLMNYHGTIVPLACAAASIMPMIGTMRDVDMFKRIPWFILMAVYFMTIFGTLFSNTGLGNFIGTLISPIMRGLSPYAFSVIGCLIGVTLVNICVNGQLAMYPLVIGVLTPICVSLGYNPSVVMWPVICCLAFFVIIMLNKEMLITKGYGWWNTKDGLLPGTLSGIMLSFVFPLSAIVIGPLVGLPLYL
ncbi:MAG: hypothetical protein IJT62_06700 [Oscillospiraceae bacterium]|nr:hypothetical protein [Oscillospiraceae bacterium]